MRGEVGQGWRGAAGGLDDGADALAEARVGHAHHGGVTDAGKAFEGFLNFLGKDLLAAGVDHLGAAAQQGDGAVLLDGRPVARHAPALALEGAEGLGRLLRILVVAARREAADRHQAADARTGQDALALFGEDCGVGTGGEFGRSSRRAAAGDRRREAKGFGGAQAVHQHDVRQVLQQALLVLGAPHGARGDDPLQTGHRPLAGIGVQSFQHRRCERRADDDQARDPQALHLVEQFRRVEFARRQGGDGAA